MKKQTILCKFNKTNILFCIALIFFIFSGCTSSGKRSYEIQNYLLDYPAPALEKLAKLGSTIRFNRFTIAAAYNNQNMIFRSDNYSLDFFSYNRWAVNPADMVADVLLRDMQASGLFHAVLSRYSPEDTDFLLEGGIGEFFLQVEKNRKLAVISLEITLKDSKKRETNKRIIFQKKYRHEELLTEQTPRGYCQAMSQALRTISPQIIADVYQAIKLSTN
jgi:ABC-type uncharacterized transport system auxiliary subunit